MKTFLLVILPFISPSLIAAFQVAVVGTTGNIGRTTIQELSKRNIPTRCLLRHDISNVEIKDTPSTSAEVAASLSTLNNVEMIRGDVTDPESIRKLIDGCDAILALQGPPKPNALLSLFPIFSNQNGSFHPYMTNYIGMKNIIEAVEATPSVKRIVRLTGKGEDPFSFFSILINMLGYMAKGWNYEGEQLLRDSGLDYTIVRPGLLKNSNDYNAPKKSRGLKDNGMDMKVTPVTYDQIAELCVESLNYDNAKKSTLTVMNVEENEGEDGYTALLESVQADSRTFEKSLIEKHKSGARLGFLGLSLILGTFLKGIVGLTGLIM